MLDRGVVKEFLVDELKEREINIPRDITGRSLVETFCRYTENDYYEWLKDNFQSFFNHRHRNRPNRNSKHHTEYYFLKN